MPRTRPVRRRLRSASSPAPSLPEPKAIVPDIWYSEEECAAFLRLRNKKTLCVWRSRGEHPELRHSKPFGKTLYRGSDIIAFLSGNATAPETSKRKAKVAR
jgi:hypothetical protein